MHVAVVGSNGFIGSKLCRALPLAGHAVSPISSTSDGFDATTGLLRDQTPASVPLDAMVYLSQSPHYRQVPEQAPHLWAVNVVSAIKAAEWAVRCGARRIVHASTGNVYAPSFEPHRETDAVNRDDWYALSKSHAEEALQLFDAVAVTSVRLFGVYGPGQRMKLVPNLAAKILNNEEIRLSPHPVRGEDGGLHLSLTYIDDVTRILIHLLTEDGPAILNVASPQVLSVRAMADSIAGRLGRQARLCHVLPPRQFDLIADVSLLARLMGASFTSFDDGVDDTLRAMSAPANP
jgi:nucleoside-diphosphate-sugar epimerase